MSRQLTLFGEAVPVPEKRVSRSVGRREKFTVVFEAETIVNDRYPEYEEKLLWYDGKPIPYKAIVYNGKLMAIVSRSYVLVPHEEVIEAVGEVAGDHIDDIVIDSRHARMTIWLDYGDLILLVRNSIDGTVSLRVDTVFKVDGAKTYFGCIVYRRHVGTVVDWLRKTLPVAISESREKMQKFKEWLEKLASVENKYEYREQLRDLLPEKYTKGITLLRNMKDVYLAILRRIWSSIDASIERKIELNRRLNNFMFLIVEFEG